MAKGDTGFRYHCMPAVTKTYTGLSVPNNPESPVQLDMIDLSVLLSEYYGKNIRQGMNFKLKGVQATLRPNTSGDFDVGSSCIVKHEYCPTTAHSRKAWNDVFSQWKKQNSLSSRTKIRYNDFEVGFHASYLDSDRTSKLFATGLGDSNEESVVLFGDSTGGSDFALQDYYNAMYKAPEASVDHFNNTALKDPKFLRTKFPVPQMFYCSATASTIVTDNDISDMYSGSMVSTDVQEFPFDLNILAGVMKLLIYIPQDDTLSQWADTFTVDITYYVSSWSPLVYKAKKNRRKSSKRTMRRFRGRRSSRKSNRR